MSSCFNALLSARYKCGQIINRLNTDSTADMPTQKATARSRADAAVDKVVGRTTAATLAAIDREICSEPNCARCRNKTKAVARWKPRVGIADVYSDED